MLDTRALPLIDVAGSHRQIGRQFGEQLRDEVRAYSEMWLAKATRRSGLGRDALLDHITGFVHTIDEYAPRLGEEIRGVAAGAGIAEREAFAIQVRMELLFAGPPPPSCTTVALTGDWTATGEPIVGQNVDLDSEVERYGLILRMRPDDGPAVLMYTSPGLVSYVGLNDAGLAVHGNLLVSPGWRAGFPRYLLTRLMLAETSVEAALEAAQRPPRASSRNLILGDAGGAIADIELAVDDACVLRSARGMLVHTNHFVAPGLEGIDTYIPASSQQRQARMTDLLESAERPVTVEELQAFFRDHEGYPASICAHVAEGGAGKTVASVISEPAAGRMHATFGSPCQREYVVYEF
jgi:isopenicillin-N N-acyltransferase-like protein